MTDSTRSTSVTPFFPRRGAVGVAACAAAAALVLSGGGVFDDLFGDDSPDRDDETGEVTEVTEGVSIFDIEVGDCIGPFEAGDEGGIDEVDLYPCDVEHEQQVFLITQITDDELPDDEAVRDQVIDECLPVFEEFVGLEYEESVLDINYLSPSADTWEEDDRDIVCTIYDPGGPVTGSLEGAAR
jgi:hypothetical protein